MLDKMEMVRVQRKAYKRVLIGIILAIFVVVVTIFAFSTNRYSNLTDIYMERWSELPNETDNIWCDNYQRVDEKFYYVNEENVLCVKGQNDEKEIVENVSWFVVQNDMIFYMRNEKGDEGNDGIFCMNITEKKSFEIIEDSVYEFGIQANKIIYITTSYDVYSYQIDTKEKSVLYDRKGREQDFWEQQDTIYLLDDYLVLHESGKKVKCLCLKTGELREQNIPSLNKDNYYISTTLKMNDGIYYSLFLDENESLPSYYSKGDDVQSGIYFLDIERNKYNKISDDSGLYLIELSGTLYACDTGFLFMDLREIGELYEE